MKKAITYITYSFIACFMIACNTSDAPTPDTLSELVNKWKVESVLFGSTDVTAQYTNYTIEFKEDNTYLLTKADGSSEAGSWTVSSDNKTITITPTGGTAINFTEATISATKLTYNAEEVSAKTGTVAVTFTLVPA
ncbi:MAG TPA: hypothetical protein DCS93_08025 [Microscillaceae bacterium]|nr:hypothetical protein [Microscillaceae bacterium]